MGLSNLGSGASSSGLLRNLLNTKTESPTQTAGFDPAMAALNKEPLSRTPPPGTSQIVSDKPPLDLNTMQEQLQSMPVPSPEQAAQLIQAMVTPPQAQAASQPQSQPNTYTVKSGDTLSRIAQQYGVPIQSITGYRSGNPNLIYPGEVLTIGGGHAQAPQPQAQPVGQVQGVATQSPYSRVSYAGSARPSVGPSRLGTQFNTGGPISQVPQGELRAVRPNTIVPQAFAGGPGKSVKEQGVISRILQALSNWASGASIP